MENIKFILSEVKTFFRGLIIFIKQIPGYYKLYTWYEYDPLDYYSIIFNYEKVLSNRTKRMSKPTYVYLDVMMELDEYYDEIYKEEIEALEKEIDRLEKIISGF